MKLRNGKNGPRPSAWVVRRCYWCERKATDHRRATLSGPAKKRVYVCRDEAMCWVSP